jgi:general secretion pathway protein G
MEMRQRMIYEQAMSHRKLIFLKFLLLGLIIGMAISAYIFLRPKFPRLTPVSSAIESDFVILENGLIMYKQNAGFYPSTEQGLASFIARPTSDPTPNHWVQLMDKLPLDPWGQPYHYVFPGSKDSSKPEIISFGPDGTGGTDDDLRSQDE